ncbi:tumor necrosis factor ligand superfamily member 10 [Narcine bancroftii]|uniref:tumor necrosis factor ligand superfamily member 10 n=1 Tax=Narcine bancroftii TaxID=1343680 RepID=UPI0038317A49
MVRCLREENEVQSGSLRKMNGLKIDSGKVLEDWKVANVVLQFKKGERLKKGNDRPIILTSTTGTESEAFLAKQTARLLNIWRGPAFEVKRERALPRSLSRGEQSAMGSSQSPMSGRRLACLLASLLVVQAVCLTVTFLHLSHQLKQIEATFSKNSMICLTEEFPNHLAGYEEDSDLYGFKRDEQVGSSKDLCSKLRGQIQQLVQEMISKKYGEDMSLIVKGEVSRILPYLSRSSSALPSVQKIAAHLIGNHRTKAISQKGSMLREFPGQKIQAWEPNLGLAFLHNLEYRNGELIVPRNGLYYVYGQTYFRQHQMAGEEGPSPQAPSSASQNKQMALYIYKLTAYPKPILLMKHTRTTCWARNAEYGLHSVYQGGLFNLRYGDRIFMAVSNVSLIDVAGGSSFFGAFLIS